MALILGIDRFLSAGRAVVNIMGNAVAAVVMASLEGELDASRMLRVLNGAPLEDLPAGNAIRAHVQCAPAETNRGTSI
jgi:aerobic C4-dicarboxylate transport protein